MPTPSRPARLALNEYDINDPIPPLGRRIFSVIPGRYFYVEEASHSSFRLVLNDEVRIKGRLARGHLFPEGQRVSKIEIQNTSVDTPLTCLITVGEGRPLDEGLNVYTEQITPTVRTENPSAFTCVEMDCTGYAGGIPFLPADCDRAEVWLFTEAGGVAFWGPDITSDWPSVDGNQIGLTLEGATKLRTCAPIFIRGAAGVTVYAYVFVY